MAFGCILSFSKNFTCNCCFRYARNLPVSHQSLQIKCKLCQLVDVVSIFSMSRASKCILNKWMRGDSKENYTLF